LVLEGLRKGLRDAISKLMHATSVDEAVIKEFVRDLQRTLLIADVDVKLTLEVTSKIQSKSLSETPPPGLSRKDHIVKILYDELRSILGEEFRLRPSPDKTLVILLVGIQGSGKTTVVAKLARYLKKKGLKVGAIGADTFRPGALTQLKTLCDRVGVEVFGDEKEKRSVNVAQRGIKYFKEQSVNAILVDTAGRHKEETGLIEEMKQISSVVHPDLSLLVIDGTIGQACRSQAEAFHNAVPIGGIVVTKLDGAAKGGGALAAAAATGARVMFIGTGERIDDLEEFSPSRFVGRLLGMGDLKALIERARDLELEADEEKVRRIMAGKMTIDDLYYQLEQIKKMGSLRKILELIPGLSGSIKEEGLEELEHKMTLWRYAIQSMTREERTDPTILNASRIRRVARGSGLPEKEVRDMLAKYRQTKNVMRQSKGRALRQLMKRFSP